MKALEFIPVDRQYPDPEGSVFIKVGAKATLEDICNEVDKLGDYYLPHSQANRAFSHLQLCAELPPRSELKSTNGAHVAISYTRQMSTVHGDRDMAIDWLWEGIDIPPIYELRFIKRKLTENEVEVLKEKTIVRLMRRGCISDGLLRAMAEAAVNEKGVVYFNKVLKEFD